LCVYPMGGTIDGQRGDHVLLAPPLIVREPDIDEIVARLRRAIDNAISEVRREALPEGDTISTEEVQ
jgi:adenosylmethionine-8-amino-7-oxononanoate aminotransferase